MKKGKIWGVVLIGLLLAVGLFLAGCDDENCPGNGNCVVTIDQGDSGLFVDNSVTRSTCGKSSTWDYQTSSYTGGCRVQNNIDNRGRTHGSHSCNC